MAHRKTTRTTTRRPVRQDRPAVIHAWDAMDEEAARAGAATIRSMKSIAHPRRTGRDRDSLTPGKHHVPMKGTGAGAAR